MRPKIKILKMGQPNTKVVGKRKYRLLDDWYCIISVNDVRINVLVKSGAIWDGASIPRPFWSILGLYPGGLMLAPSLPHDGWCLTHSGNTPEWFFVTIYGCSLVITPYIRDLIFRESCKYVGILGRRARIMWFAVMMYQKVQCVKQGIKYK